LWRRGHAAATRAPRIRFNFLALRKLEDWIMRKTILRLGALAGLGLGLAACADTYSPGQRAVGGGLLGGAAGAGIGSLSGNAGTGALIGGALGAVGGAATTPDRPRDPYYRQPGYGQPAYGPPPGYGPRGYGGY